MERRDPSRVGALLRHHRIAAALSQEALAERARLSGRAISDLERGIHRVPRLETVRLLADALALGEAERAELLAAAHPRVLAPAEREGAHLPAWLPVPPTRLIGREPEVAAVTQLLAQDQVRLVTLTGAGGTGKTRLALAVAADLRDQYADGVYFVDLSPLTDSALVMPTIAATLGVRDVVGQPLSQSLAGILADKQLLLLLDNCEHVVDAAPELATLLATSPRLVVLATSRGALRIRGEREISLPPLPLPASDHLPPLDELARVPAVALFIDLAAASQPDFALTADNATAVAGICRRLDGLPLAIELAAARIKVLTPAALLTRLEQRLPLLTGGSRDLPTRQRTMRDAITWSYDLLAPHEQKLFRRLGIFAGGFTLAAADAVAVRDEDLSILDGVVALVEQSLVRQMPGIADEPRYQMLETVREFALEQLTMVGELDDARERHAQHFFTHSGSVVQGIQIFMPLESLSRVAPEQDNVRLALAWFDDHDENEALLGLSSLVYCLWLAEGQYREGLGWLERALERSSQSRSGGRVQALVAAGMLALFQGDYARAATFSAEGVALAEEVGDPLLVGQALTLTGFLAYRQGKYGQSEELLKEGYARLSQLGDTVPAALADSGVALLVLGTTALVQEQFDPAASWTEASLERFQRAGNDWGIGEAQNSLGAVGYCTGDFVAAAAHYMESLDRARTLRHPLLAGSSLYGLAGVAAALRQPEAGARLLGAAEGIGSSLGAPMYPGDRLVHERALAALTVTLEPEQFAAAREAGRLLTLEAALAEAAAVAEVVIRSS